MICNRINYGSKRQSEPTYIVLHYTAGSNDTAKNNADYFSKADTGKTSAHFFVDENEIVSSVPVDYVAYHCGGTMYKHPACRNSNSIGIEICTKKTENFYYFSNDAVDRAACLVWLLMEKYSIPLSNVVRHYDVTGKICPAPFVLDGGEQWNKFLERVMEMADRRFLDVDPESWYAPYIDYCLEHKIMNGVDENKFEPNRPATRAELAAVICRLHERIVRT